METLFDTHEITLTVCNLIQHWRHFWDTIKKFENDSDNFTPTLQI